MTGRFAVTLVGILLLAACTSSVPVGTPAPSFTATDRDGNVISLAAMRGHVLILDFWAVW